MNVNLKLARIRAGLKQRELAELMGLTEQAVSGFETGRKRPTREELRAIADILRVSLTQLEDAEAPPSRSHRHVNSRQTKTRRSGHEKHTEDGKPDDERCK
jgi:transcriptional regulator with XRE-family HTH domain